MTFRGLAVFSVAMLFGTMQACRPAARVVPAAPAPPRVVPAPVPIPPSLPAAVPPVILTPELPAEPDPIANPWKPVAEEREWTSIVIHHTATLEGSVESIHETHLAREWLGIGYHFVIGNGNGMGDGEIEDTFRWREQLHGAHAGSEEYNQHGVGIALIGNFEEHPPTPAQLAAVKKLVAVLTSEYGIDREQVIGHSEVKATACPGKLFPLSEVRQASLGASAYVPAVSSVRAASVRRPLAVFSGSRLP